MYMTKTKFFAFRISESDYYKIKALADKEGLKMAEYIRYMALLPQKKDEILKEISQLKFDFANNRADVEVQRFFKTLEWIEAELTGIEALKQMVVDTKSRIESQCSNLLLVETNKLNAKISKLLNKKKESI